MSLNTSKYIQKSVILNPRLLIEEKSYRLTIIRLQHLETVVHRGS